MNVARWFSIDEAQAKVPELRALADELIEVRASLTEARHQQFPQPTATADAKGLEAALSDVLDRITGLGAHVKGIAPLLVDFPAQHDGRTILLCWLEGDETIAWYHDAEHGFAGRRPLDRLT